MDIQSFAPPPPFGRTPQADVRVLKNNDAFIPPSCLCQELVSFNFFKADVSPTNGLVDGGDPTQTLTKLQSPKMAQVPESI